MPKDPLVDSCDGEGHQGYGSERFEGVLVRMN